MPLLYAGASLISFGLLDEAWDEFARLIQIGEKIGDYNRMAQTSLIMSRLLEARGHFEEALPWTLKAVEYFEKTDATREQEKIYANLTRQHARVGNIELAEEYYKKLIESLPKTRPTRGLDSDPTAISRIASDKSRLVTRVLLSSREVARAEAVFSVVKNRWEEANKYFEEAVRAAKETGLIGLEVGVRADYIWALKKQERTGEAQVQLEEIQKIYEEVEKRFGHVDIEGSLMAPIRVLAGEEFEMRLDLVNVSRKPGLLVKVKGMVLPEFGVTSPPANYRLENGSIEMKNRSIGPFQVETVKLKIKASKAGAFSLNPQVTFIDELGEAKVCKPNPITITVQPAQPKYEVLPGRIPTGFAELDALLFGGIPQNYAVALTAPSTDERELLIKRFLDAGATKGETIFQITTEAGKTKALTEKYPSNFYLFLCNPQADAMVQSLPNVFKLKGVENLTEIDIALTKAFRTLDPSRGPKRMCIEIISDALLQHHAVITRRWLSALLPTLKSKGFTILAVVDPQMHPAEEVQAILGLFEGEVRVSEKETPQGTRQTLKIRKLYDQKYQENEIVLTK